MKPERDRRTLQVLSIKTAAGIARVSEQEIFNAIQAGDLAARSYLQEVRKVSEADLEEWINHRRETICDARNAGGIQ